MSTGPAESGRHRQGKDDVRRREAQACLEAVRTRTFGNGNVLLTYVPAT